MLYSTVRKIRGKAITPGADVTLTLSEDCEIATDDCGVLAEDRSDSEEVESNDIKMPSEIEKSETNDDLEVEERKNGEENTEGLGTSESVNSSCTCPCCLKRSKEKVNFLEKLLPR